MTARIWIVPALAVAALAGEKQAVMRENNYWVDTVTGSAPVTNALRVTTLGAVTVEGGARGGVVTYSLKRRVKASGEDSARALLDKIAVKTFQKEGWTVLEVTVPVQTRGSTDLALHVPRGLRETALASSGGAIRATDLDGAFRADTRGGAVEVDRVQGAVTVRTGGGAVRAGRIGGPLECYSGGGAIVAETLGGEAGLNTGGGEIFVREAKARVRARTAGGNIRIERAVGGVQVAADAGLIDVLEAGGPVIAETGAGSIKIRSAANVQCESGAGTIHIQALSGMLRATTKAGSIVADLGGAARLQDSALSTTAGDITVLIPSNLAVTVEAINSTPGAHRIVSDFQEIRPRSEQGNSRSEAGGAIHGGGPVLRLAAQGGTIYLRRQK
jgi:DUF4097 and DUF4098 domain-containing protein YvlB